jgi:hypothetical protein
MGGAIVMTPRRLSVLALLYSLGCAGLGCAGLGCAHAPPDAGRTPDELLASRAARFRDYPSSLPICAAWLPFIMVDDALGTQRPPDEVLTVRGRVTPIDMPCTAASCPSGAVCCQSCQFRFGLISPSGHILRLDRWREAPGFERDCDPRAAAWMPTLVIAVSGFLSDDPTSESGPMLTVDRTCRIE